MPMPIQPANIAIKPKIKWNVLRLFWHSLILIHFATINDTIERTIKVIINTNATIPFVSQLLKNVVWSSDHPANFQRAIQKLILT